MAQVTPIIRVELDPNLPVPEACAVIMALTPHYPGGEREYLEKLKEAIEQRLVQFAIMAKEGGRGK